MTVMRWQLPLVLGLAGLVGCVTDNSSDPSASYPGGKVSAPAKRKAPVVTKTPTLIVTPAAGSLGKISSVNVDARYVVVTCLPGGLPAVERRLAVYRDGLKVGEIKITGPQLDTNTAADIVAGECRIGDEVREH